MYYSRVPIFSAFCIWVLHRLHRVPDLPYLCRARVTRRRRSLPEPLQVCTALPSPTRRPTTPPTARAASAGHSPRNHVGPPVPSGCHAPEGHAGAARCPEPPRDCPSLSLSSTRSCSPIKPEPTPFPRLLSCCSSSRHRARRHTPSPEFAATSPPRPNPSCPPLPHPLH
jgi:hypothetical protein